MVSQLNEAFTFTTIGLNVSNDTENENTDLHRLRLADYADSTDLSFQSVLSVFSVRALENLQLNT